MPGTAQILLGCIPGAHQVAKSLVALVGDVHERQVAGAELSHQVLGVAPVRLDASGLARDQRGCTQPTLEALARQVPLQPVPAGPAS